MSQFTGYTPRGNFHIFLKSNLCSALLMWLGMKVGCTGDTHAETCTRERVGEYTLIFLYKKERRRRNLTRFPFSCFIVKNIRVYSPREREIDAAQAYLELTLTLLEGLKLTSRG